MSQASHVIDGTLDGATYTQNLNAALAALLTKHSGVAGPGTTGQAGQPLAYQWWANTSSGMLCIRDSTNSTWVAVAPLAGLFANGLCQNLKITHPAGGNTVTAFTVTADALSVQGTYLASFTLNYSSANPNGANGLDTGSLAANTWYALHVICSDDASLVALLLSLSATGPALPSGYVNFRRVGWLFSTGAGGPFRAGTQVGGLHTWDTDDDWTALTNGHATSMTNVSLANYVPPGIVRALVSAAVDSGGSPVVTTTLNVAPGGSAITSGRQVCRMGGPNQAGAAEFWIGLDGSRQFRYAVSNGVLTALAQARGWYDPAVA